MYLQAGERRGGSLDLSFWPQGVTMLCFTGTELLASRKPRVQRCVSLYAVPWVSLCAPLCQPWCLPEPLLSSFSTVIWQAACAFREELGLSLSSVLEQLGPGVSRDMQ